MEPTHIFILSPRRSETSMSIPQWDSHLKIIYICPCIMIKTLEMEKILAYANANVYIIWRDFAYLTET